MTYEEMLNDPKNLILLQELVPAMLEWEEPGMKLIGRLVSIDQLTDKVKGTTYNKYVFDTDRGLTSVTLGSKVDGLIQDTMVGEILVITYKGQVETRNGNHMNDFSVMKLNLPKKVIR